MRTMRRKLGLVALLVSITACGDGQDGEPALDAELAAQDAAATVVPDAAWVSPEAGPSTDAGSSTDASRPDRDAGLDSGPLATPDAAALDAAPTADGGATSPVSMEAGTRDAAALGDGSAVDGGSGEDGSAAVRYVGRVDVRGADDARFSWPGTGVVARFRGTSLGVKLSGGRDYTVLIDGLLRPKLVVSTGTTKIADNLADAVHTVELYRRVQGGGEGGVGASLFQGFSFSVGGTLLSPPAAPARRIEIVGDSISCGTGIEGANESCGLSADTENHYLTYGAIAARNLGAELHTIAIGGKGLYCNYSDCPTSTDPVPSYFDRTLREDPTPRWDFARYQPDAVVINLGTNDFNHDRAPSEANFTNAYRSFLQRVRSNYPNAKILCTIGPMLWGDSLTKVRRSITSAVAALGDSKISSFEIAPQDKDQDGIGCGWHPNKKTHQKMAATLESSLKAALGW